MADPRQAILTFAAQQEGKPYKWGAVGPYSFDCSGLVYAAEKAAGLNVTRSTSINEVRAGTRIDKGAAVPGDLVYINGAGYEDHSGIYVGNGRMIDAPTEGQTVGVRNVPAAAQFWTPAGTSPGSSSSPSWLNPVGALTSVVGDAAGAVTGSVGDVFGGWQTGLVGIGLKIAAASVAGALVVVGAWQALHTGDAS